MNNGKAVRSVLLAAIFLTIFAMVACSSDDDSITDIEWQWESVTDRPTSETTTDPTSDLNETKPEDTTTDSPPELPVPGFTNALSILALAGLTLIYRKRTSLY